MAATAAILKFFKRHLPNRKLDNAETWWEASEWHRDSELLKSFCSDIKDGNHGCHLENLQTSSAPKWQVRLSRNFSHFWHVLQNRKSDWAENLVGSIGAAWRFRIAKIVAFQYPWGRHDSHLENLQTTPTPGRYVGLNPNLVVGIEATWRFIIVKTVSFRYPRWPP